MKLLTKLTVTNFLFGLFGLVATGLLFYIAVQTAVQNRAKTDQLNQTRQTMRVVDRFLYERRQDIQQLSDRTGYVHAASKAATAAETATATKSLNDVRQANNFWRGFSILDTSATVRVSSSDKGAVLGLGENAHLGDLYYRALTGQSVYSDVFLSPALKEPTLVFMSPIYDGKNVIGVVSGSLAWESVEEILHDAEGVDMDLLNKDGILIAGTQNDDRKDILRQDYHATSAFKRIQARKTGSDILPSFAAGKSMLTSYAGQAGFEEFKGNGWYLVLTSLPRLPLGFTVQLSIGLAALFAAITAIAIGLLYLLLQRIVRPVKTLTTAVARITLGDLSQEVTVVSDDEMGILSRNFNEMTHQLANTHRNLNEATRIAQQERAQLEASINGLRQGFVLTNAGGMIIMANQAAREMLRGSSSAKSDKKKLDDLSALVPEDLELPEKIHQTLRNRKQGMFPDLALNGRFYNLYLSPVVSEEEVIGCVCLLEDITEQRILQRSRDEFFSIASHELRTPLTAIKGNTSMMLDYYPEAFKDPELRQMAMDIHDSSDRLIEIVSTFLDMSRLEQDKMQFTPEPFKIESVIERVIYEMGTMSREKGVALTFDQNTLGNLPEVFADQSRVKQVLYNLMGNALKFTENGKVIINCLVQSDSLKVTVTDTGKGISPEGQQILFHKFQQSSDSILTRDSSRSTGLGLYISRLLVEHMGGEIKLEHSELGKGTTFSFALPIAKPGDLAQTGAKNKSNLAPAEVTKENDDASKPTTIDKKTDESPSVKKKDPGHKGKSDKS